MSENQKKRLPPIPPDLEPYYCKINEMGKTDTHQESLPFV
jgi:hypothetical protein